MRYGRAAGLIGVIVIVVGLAGGAVVWRRSRAVPATLTGPNILKNNDFAVDADKDGMPDGWTAADKGSVRFSDYRFQRGAPGRAMQMDGINNWLGSPWVVARPGAKYRVAFRALADNPQQPSPTRVRVRFHWRDAEGVEFSNVAGTWQNVPPQAWAIIADAAVAPAEATQLSISIHVASDDRIIVDELGLGQVGVRIAPWPRGKAAALALSFDYETAMGGLIHTRSDDPSTTDTAVERAGRMRAGAENILRLFGPARMRGTWYTTGYTFLTGNRERRQFMGNPTYSQWATKANGWPTDRWERTPWFADDPGTDEQSAPAWYFGSQIPRIKAANQDIQSLTFAHFAGGLVRPDDWRADFKAWDAVAGAAGVAKPVSLAFPWSWSAGMQWDSWEALKANGITSVTRTNWNQPRFRIADRDTYALRRIPGHATMTVIADEYLTPSSLKRVEQRLDLARLNEGAIDLWSHTEEVTSPAQRAAWAQIVALREPFWVASVPDIVGWSRALEHVSVELRAEKPRYIFRVVNDNPEALRGLALVLPFAPARLTVDGRTVSASGDNLVLDIPARTGLEVTLWPA